MKLIYSGSVKDVYADGSALVFTYSDRYSAFDWGHMPDDIPGKGKALASMAATFFELLAERGIRSHYLAQTAANSIRVQPVAVHRPEWHGGGYDYSAYKARPTHALVPLEVVFRQRLSLGNSLEKRLHADPAYLKDLGLAHMPAPDARFDPPLVEFSTKLESTDRYLSHAEITRNAIASLDELQRLQQLARRIAGELEQIFKSIAVELWDGKFEFAFGAARGAQAEFMLVDSIGPDELRLTFGGLPLSKEFLRQIYTHTPWVEGVARAKALARERGTRDWKKICVEELKLTPRKLTPDELEAGALLYQALANEVARAAGRALPFDAAIDLNAWHGKAKRLGVA